MDIILPSHHLYTLGLVERPAPLDPKYPPPYDVMTPEQRRFRVYVNRIQWCQVLGGIVLSHAVFCIQLPLRHLADKYLLRRTVKAMKKTVLGVGMAWNLAWGFAYIIPHTGLDMFGCTIIPQLLPDSSEELIGMLDANRAENLWPCRREVVMAWRGDWQERAGVEFREGARLASTLLSELLVFVEYELHLMMEERRRTEEREKLWERENEKRRVGDEDRQRKDERLKLEAATKEAKEAIKLLETKSKESSKGINKTEQKSTPKQVVNPVKAEVNEAPRAPAKTPEPKDTTEKVVEKTKDIEGNDELDEESEDEDQDEGALLALRGAARRTGTSEQMRNCQPSDLFKCRSPLTMRRAVALDKSPIIFISF